MNVRISAQEAADFAATLATPEYAADERDYKVAVHEVLSRLLAPSELASSTFLDRLAAFFERRLDISELGIEPDLAEWIDAAVASLYGVTNAFINLAGGRFAVNNFIWIPRAITGGFGEEVRHAFQTLIHDDQPLAARVDGFREELYRVEERTEAAGLFEPNWHLVKIQLGFVATLLAAYDPQRYTFYPATALRSAYEELVGPWPRGTAGERYEAVCQFVQSVREELVGLGAPAQDMIDAQSFLWLRRPDEEAAPSEEVAATPTSDQRSWIFQANPDYYALDGALQELDAIEWTIKKHRTEIKPGDRVYMWRSGSQAAIVAVGHVAGPTEVRPPSEAERPYYLRPDLFAESEPRADVAVDAVLGQPIPKSQLEADATLSELTLLRMRGRGTNFAVTPEQDVALRRLLDEDDVAASPVQYFVLQQGTDRTYGWDEEGSVYHFTPRASGAWRRFLESSGAEFVYYRPSSGQDELRRTFFGVGKVSEIETREEDDGRHFLAHLQDYVPFMRPVPRSEFDPRSNVQMSISEITKEQFDELKRRGGELESEPFTVAAIVRAATRAPRELRLDEAIYASVFAALESGKHVILTGPPGTAKTTLAEAVADAAARAGLCTGHVLTTATADWTTYETIGGLRPARNGELIFAPGHFLEAIEQNRWLVIDELNRSNFDRAFGQLFTVLSGQAVQLPYSRGDRGDRLTLAPAGASVPSGTDALRIPVSWRVIATMNVFDKSLLFEMSFALMRRFAFIEVASPSRDVFDELIESSAGGPGPAALLTRQFLPLRELKDLGPAIFMDMARYLKVREQLDGAVASQLAFEAFYSYLLPQFEGIDEVAGERLYRQVRRLVGPENRERLRDTLRSVLGLELSEGSPAFDETSDEGPDEFEEPSDSDVAEPGEV